MTIERKPIILGGKFPSAIREWMNNEFGTIHTIMIEDKPWFLGTEVANCLGYSNSRKALKDHVQSQDKRKIRMPDKRVGNPTQIYLNEMGIKTLIVDSSSPIAKPLKRLILQSTNIDLHQLFQTLKTTQIQPDTKSIYVAQFEKQHIKIGVSNKVYSRLKNVEKSTNDNLITYWNTNQIEKSKAFTIEKQSHCYFHTYNTHGEYFNIDYQTACDKVQEFYNQLAG